MPDHRELRNKAFPPRQKMKYTEAAIVALYKKSLNQAEKKLSSLPVAQGRLPTGRGLNGWVFEQTIRYCLSLELRAVGLRPPMEDQVSLKGRAKIDLLVGKVAVEVKAAGCFGTSDVKYDGYGKAVAERGWVYAYLSLEETHVPYRRSTIGMFGAGFAFFLDTKGDWKRFVKTVIENHA